LAENDVDKSKDENYLQKHKDAEFLAAPIEKLSAKEFYDLQSFVGPALTPSRPLHLPSAQISRARW
jgi:hypothetical protein